MRAYVINEFGAPGVFHAVEVDRPVIGNHQILVEVHATSVNPLDFKLRRGDLPHFAPDFPAILHSDFAGKVVEAGPCVSSVGVGNLVYGCAGGVRGRQGALADYMVVDEAFVCVQPISISEAEAGVLPLVSIAAWEGIIDKANIQLGDRVLVHAGTGGVGHIAAQLASWRGAEVFTTVSSEQKAKLSKSFGADETIIYTQESVEEYVRRCTGGEGFEVVFDTVGGRVLRDSINAASVGGQVLSLLAIGDIDITRAWAYKLSLHCVNMSWPMATGVGAEHHRYILQQLAKLVDAGIVTPLVDERVFQFEDIVAAHAYAESGNAVGKISVVHG